MILAETPFLSPEGWQELAWVVAAGIATAVLIWPDKAKEKAPATKSGWTWPKLPFIGSSDATEPPSVGEADELFQRLDLLSGELVDDFGKNLHAAWKLLTWKKADEETEQVNAAP